MKRSPTHHRWMMPLCVAVLVVAATVLALQGTGALLPAAIVAICGSMMLAMFVMAVRDRH